MTPRLESVSRVRLTSHNLTFLALLFGGIVSAGALIVGSGEPSTGSRRAGRVEREEEARAENF